MQFYEVYFTVTIELLIILLQSNVEISFVILP